MRAVLGLDSSTRQLLWNRYGGIASAGAVLVAIALSLGLGAVLLWILGDNPWDVYGRMWQGSLGSPQAVGNSVAYAIPVLLCGLAASLAFRVGFWNIGGDGQLVMGAFGASWVALTFVNLPGPVAVPAILAAGLVGGALWGLIPAVLRVWLGVNEVMTSLLLNYVGLLWIDFLIYGPWRNPRIPGAPNSAPFPEAAWLPTLPGTGVHVGLLIGVAVAILIYVVLRHTVWGYELTVMGRSTEAARYAGIPLKRNLLLVMLVSGGLAGIAGVGEVSGVAHRLFKLDGLGYGYIGILVAWLTRLNPLALIVVAFFYGALLQGGVSLQTAGLRISVVSMLQAAIVLLALAAPAVAAHLSRARGKLRPLTQEREPVPAVGKATG